ncbi:Do family serine endopeptidase [Buchnera aphidicola]|uniref:Do family serine endopeptidase n=1 Tax=Buchnera aphidicola TaxID=9 RepID=UPI003464CB33
MKKITIAFSIIMLVLVLLFSSKTSWGIESVNNINKFSSPQSFPSLAPMLEKATPSVISINIEGQEGVKDSNLSYQFKSFFSKNLPFCQKELSFYSSSFCHIHYSSLNNRNKYFHALGSGVIINAKKGYAVTNYHVVKNARKIQIILHDGRRYKGKLVGKDPHSDIALIQLVGAKNLKEIKIANSDFLRVGDYTVAIGNPYGLGQTVTSGIISALGRTGLNIEHYENFIQTDAAINRGNSGGALLNLQGELIGINTAILAPDGGNIGIGFAIPVNMVKNLTEQIELFGQVQRGELGIVGIELNADLSKIMHINIQKGAFVSQVLSNSSAFNAGIRAGDVIVSLNDKIISSFAALRAEVSSLPVKTKIKLGIFRQGKVHTTIVELQNASHNSLTFKNTYSQLEGMQLKNVFLNGKTIVQVTRVIKNTQASRVGFKKNDIIISFNKKVVNNLRALKKMLDMKPNVLVFYVQRGNSNIFLVI